MKKGTKKQEKKGATGERERIWGVGLGGTYQYGDWGKAGACGCGEQDKKKKRAGSNVKTLEIRERKRI